MNNVTKSRAYNIEERRKRGRPRLYSSPAAKQAAYRERKNPPRLEVGTRVSHPRNGIGVITNLHGERFIVAFQTKEGRIWRDLEAASLEFAGRVKRLPKWTDASRPLSRNWKPPRKWLTPLPASELHTGIDGEKIVVPVYGVRRAGKRRTRRDYTKLIDHNLAVLLEGAKR